MPCDRPTIHHAGRLVYSLLLSLSPLHPKLESFTCVPPFLLSSAKTIKFMLACIPSFTPERQTMHENPVYSTLILHKELTKFKLEKDIENYLYVKQFKPESRVRIRLKPDAIPSKFQCQTSRLLTEKPRAHTSVREKLDREPIVDWQSIYESAYSSEDPQLNREIPFPCEMDLAVQPYRRAEDPLLIRELPFPCEVAIAVQPYIQAEASGEQKKENISDHTLLEGRFGVGFEQGENSLIDKENMDQGQPILTLYCYYCGFSAKSKPLIRQHVIKCMQHILFGYNALGQTLTSDTCVDYLLHKIKETMELLKTYNLFYCYYCNFSTNEKKNIRRHVIECMENTLPKYEKDYFSIISQVSDKKVHCCTYCDYTTNHTGHLKRHLRSHTGEKLYSCTYCDYITNHTGHLEVHLRTHTGEKPYSCEFCDYTASQAGNLKQHLRSHTGEKPYSCAFCDYTANQAGSLKQHLRSHTGEKPYSCTYCDYTANQAGSLKQHLRIHRGEKPYSCTYCSYTAYGTANLKRHLRTHTGEKPYSCTYCAYTSNDSGTLKKHLRIHTGEKPYSCRYCDYTANQAGSLKKHLRTHTGEKHHSCTYCDYTAKQARYLRQHLRNHMEGESHSCTYCNYITNHAGNLKRHLRTHTGEKTLLIKIL